MNQDSQANYVLDNINVLILDDNRHMRSLVQSILHALGVKQIREASDAPEAFKELQHFHADVIIADWHMEPLDGLDFVRLVRTAKDSPNLYVPIIMLTGHTEYQRVCEARDAGVNEFLAKPISARALYTRFASIIENPRPFIRTKTYFGPDRRRQNLGPPRGVVERRKDEIEKIEKAAEAEQAGLSQDEVEALLDK
jgi:CheY-like chemotaxis protein